MPIPDTVGAFAIVLSNDLKVAIPFWERMGFARTGGDSNYIIMTGWGCEVQSRSQQRRRMRNDGRVWTMSLQDARGPIRCDLHCSRNGSRRASLRRQGCAASRPSRTRP
jgi:hypothetical protein